MTSVSLTETPTGSEESRFQRTFAQVRLGLPVYLWLVILVLLPNILLIGTSFLRSSSGLVQFEPTFYNYQRLSHSEAFWVLLFKTVSTAAGASFLATLVAYPMAYYASRKLGRSRLVALFLVVVPLWISLLMRVFAWKIILGDNGILNTFLISIGIFDKPSDAFLYTPFSVLLTFTYVAIPFVFVTSYSALERIPNTLIEAAQDSGASPFRAFLNVMWPLSRSGAAIGFILAFLLCIGDYITPAMVGGLDGTMLGTVIASQFGLAANWPYGAAIAIVMLAFVGVILVLVIKLSQTPGILTGEDNGSSPAIEKLNLSPADRAKALAARALFCLPYVFLYLPLTLIVVFSLNDGRVQAFPLTGFTLQWYRELLSNDQLIAAFGRTLQVSATVLVVSAAMGTIFSIILAYGKLRGTRSIEILLAIPIAIPGVVLGITMVLACQLLHVPVGIPRIVVAHCTFVMPIIMMIVLNRLRRLDPSLVEAAMDCGASKFKAFLYVLLPLIRSAILGGALLGFTVSADEVVVTSFLAGADPTLPVWVWNQMRFGFTPTVNAIFSCIGISTLVLLFIAQRLTRPKI